MGDIKFTLFGIVTHEGEDTKCGHYWAYIKHLGLWYKCDDEEVYRETFVSIQTTFQNINTAHNKITPYLLFYETSRVDIEIEEHVQKL